MNNCKRFFSLAAASAILFTAVFSCAKEPGTGKNDSSKRYFDAWISTHYPDVQPTDLGEYVIEDEVGTGPSIGEADNIPYVFVKYTVTDLDGNVTTSSDEDVEKRIGKYSKVNYYGPVVWFRDSDYMQAGVEEAIKGMKIGGTRKVIIPGWLMTYDRYDTAEDYIRNVTGTNYIYTIHIYDTTPDIVKWEVDSLEIYKGKYLDNVDSTEYGFYYQQLRAPVDTVSLPSDTTVYINYVGRLLNGQVFDTNIADTAKVYGLYSSSTTYEATQINWGDAYSNLTMTSSESSMISGFAKAVFQMKKMEKGRCIFYSPLGYGASGSGTKIPAYSMLRFDIELVAEPDD